MHVFHFGTRRTALLALGLTMVAGAATAGTVHTYNVSQGTGSLGAADFVQSSTSSSALEGNVGPADTGIGIPFGLFGVYNDNGSGTFGLGVLGISTTGYALAGQSFGGQPTILAFPGGTGQAIAATTSASSAATSIYSETKGSGIAGEFISDKAGTGVYALSENGAAMSAIAGSGGSGDAVDGNSYNGYGVYGTSFNTDGIHGEVANPHAGVSGINDAVGFGLYASQGGTQTPAPNAAAYTYAGTFSASKTGPGLYGVNSRNTGNGNAYSFLNYNRDAGVFGYAYDGPGTYAFSLNDFGTIAENDSPRAALLVLKDQTISQGVQDEILACQNDGSTAINLNCTFDATTDGNLGISGALVANLGTFTRSRNPGTDATTYASQATEATVEDYGTAQLQNGTASIALAGDFRQTIDAASPYMVFFTPHGDSNVLFLASQTPGGFVVREAHGGHSTLAFDYRIVARPWGHRQSRLPQAKTFSHVGYSAPAPLSARLANAVAPADGDARHTAAAFQASALATERARRLAAPKLDQVKFPTAASMRR